MKTPVHFNRIQRRVSERGQSLVEIALFLPIFLILIVGVVEIGYYMNHYINLLDATREAARYGADLDPVNPSVYNHNSPSYAGAVPNCDDPALMDFYAVVACYAEQNMAQPLDPANGYDDIVISAFTVENGAVKYRFPLESGESGFSYTGNRDSNFSNAAVNELVGVYTPKQGFLLVEIFWQHRQALALPIYTVFVPETLGIHVYTLMPNATAGTVD